MNSTLKRPEPRQRPGADKRQVFSGKIFEVIQWTVAGSSGREVVIEQLRRADTALVLPVTSEGNVLMAVEQQPGTDVMVRALGGRIEKSESPENAARRELREEAGVTCQSLKLWKAWQPVNKIDWAVYLFIAHGLSGDGKTHLDDTEQIHTILVPVKELLDPNTTLKLDDYELEHWLFAARSNADERAIALKLFQI